ncbi:cupin domain-containing protein [soil metagenome]
MFKPFSAFKSDAATSPAYWFLNCLWIIHATAEQTGGEYSLIEQWMPEGSGPPPHIHPIEEVFYVIEGEMTVQVGEESLVLGPGQVGNVPRNTVHHFKTTKGPCSVLNFYTPAGLELAIIGSAVPAEARTLPPKGFDKQSHEQLIKFLNNYWSAQSDTPWAIQSINTLNIID